VRTFTVHEPPDPPADLIERGERLVFVGEGFSWSALLLAPFWLLAERLWWPLLGYAAFVGLIELLQQVTGAPNTAAGLALAALHAIIALEAGALQRGGLRRRGFTQLGSVVGRSRAECERRFLEAWLPGEPRLRPASSDLVASARGVIAPSLQPAALGAPPPVRRGFWRSSKADR
jgi:hypothetical protein